MYDWFICLVMLIEMFSLGTFYKIGDKKHTH